MQNRFEKEKENNQPENEHYNNSRYYNGTDNNSPTEKEHPSYEDIMKFVTSTKEDLFEDNIGAVKMIKHFCHCENCRTIKNNMIKMENQINLALDFSIDKVL